MFGNKTMYRLLSRKLDRISFNMEKTKIKEYVEYLEHPRKMLFSSFMAGIARGFGASIGFTLLAALIMYVLRYLVQWNLPIIGKFISDIVNIVNNNINNPGR